MRFPRLDKSGTSIPVFTIGWRIEDAPDIWTKKFLAFKANEKNAIRGCASLLWKGLPPLLGRLKWAANETGITPALSSGATAADPSKPLYRTAKWLADQCGMPFLPTVFTKAAHRPLHSLPSGADRDSEVAGKYVCGDLEGVKNLIIFDDFVTRGSTLAEMLRAIIASGHGPNVIGLALAKNERASYAAQFGRTVDNSHISAEWAQLWDQAAQ